MNTTISTLSVYAIVDGAEVLCMSVLDSMVSRRCSRPAGAHEYRYRSLKSGAEVRLYDRITLWRWLTLEFDASVSDLKINDQVFENTFSHVPIVFFYSKHGRPHLVVQENTTEAAIISLHEYCNLVGITVETLEEKWAADRHVEMWNLLKMASYINKWHHRISEKRLSQVFRDIAMLDKVAIKELSEQYRTSPENLAMVFELVRRGRLHVLGITKNKISQNTQLSTDPDRSL